MTPIAPPDLSTRPFQLTAERTMAASPRVLYRAWTRKIDHWFAAPLGRYRGRRRIAVSSIPAR